MLNKRMIAQVVYFCCIVAIMGLAVSLTPHPVAAGCQQSCVDVNDCGCRLQSYPSGALDCVMDCDELYSTFTSGTCCGVQKRTITVRHFYDCNGDGRADCECRFITWRYDTTCP